MNEKLQTINSVIEEIRNEILEEECIPLEDIPNAIKNRIAMGGDGVGYVTGFLYSSDEKPSTPTATTMNFMTGEIIDPGTGWSQDGWEPGTDYAWISSAVFGPSGETTS